MSSSRPLPLDETSQIITLTEIALTSLTLTDLTERALSWLTARTQSPQALIWIADPCLSAPALFLHGFSPATVPELEKTWDEQVVAMISQGDPAPTQLSTSPTGAAKPEQLELRLYPLQYQETRVGLLGLAPCDLPGEWEHLTGLIAMAIDRLIEKARSERQLKHLNTYLTVSSMLAQSLGLEDMLETILYCCMEVATAEAATILLLDDNKANFRFFQVEGPAKPILAAATFPADKGLAGAVLRTQQSEVINDVQNDPRFYDSIDTETEFRTRNMIAVPLTAGKERIGVLEVLNKTNGGTFDEEEHLLLQSIAEEIAFAIRNAKIFEYVVNSYCRVRQGQTSCRGCNRPLGTWTPCVKYRETGTWSVL